MKKIGESIQDKEGYEKELQALVEKRKQKLSEVEAFEESREAKEQRLRDSAHGQLTQLTKEREEHRRRRHEICNQVIQLQHHVEAEEESCKNLLNRVRVMPNMKQVLEGLDSVNKVLEEVPRLKTGYHGLVITFPFVTHLSHILF